MTSDGVLIVLPDELCLLLPIQSGNILEAASRYQALLQTLDLRYEQRRVLFMWSLPSSIYAYAFVCFLGRKSQFPFPWLCCPSSGGPGLGVSDRLVPPGAQGKNCGAVDPEWVQPLPCPALRCLTGTLPEPVPRGGGEGWWNI